MRRILEIAVGLMLVGAGLARAGTLKGLEAWAGKAGDGKVVERLAAVGITNGADQAAVKAGWDEGVLVETAVKAKAYGALAWAMGVEPFSREARDRVKAAAVSEAVAPYHLRELALCYPLAERAPFREALLATAEKRFPANPVYGRMLLEYQVLQGVAPLSVKASEKELADVLLAAEVLGLVEAQQCKAALKERAVMAARTKLRVEGKSFVVKDGVNPLVEKVRPVVEALNAPECAGLEAAFRGLGVAVEDADRAGLRAKVTDWRTRIMSGEAASNETAAVLGKVAVGLGPEGFNRFVAEYNNGTGAGK